MREILFKAKRIDNGQWVHGFPYRGDSSEYCDMIIEFDGDECCCITGDEKYVDPETVCQYTGIDDCNGVKIFEGDILESRPMRKIRVATGEEVGDPFISRKEVGFFEKGRLTMRKLPRELPPGKHSIIFSPESTSEWFKVIGNIHDTKGDDNETNHSICLSNRTAQGCKKQEKTMNQNLCNSHGECTSVIDYSECKHYEPCCCSDDCEMCVHWDVYGESPEQCLCHAARAEAGAQELANDE